MQAHCVCHGTGFPALCSLTREEALTRSEVIGHPVLVPNVTGTNIPMRQSSVEVRTPGACQEVLPRRYRPSWPELARRVCRPPTAW